MNTYLIDQINSKEVLEIYHTIEALVGEPLELEEALEIYENLIF